ncbi:MAG: glycosyltransferase family 2 protein [bacterium]|nr:glycosyltransferase family 2 protein [bacterium]
MPEVSVIIPTYNERENIVELIPALARVLAGIDFEVVVVDDSSPDGTAEAARELAKQYPVQVIVRKERGLAGAVIEGIRHARGKYCIVMDADFQHPPEVIPKILQQLRQGYQVVVASRYIKGGSTEKWSFTRKFISKTATFLAHFLFPETKNVQDIMSGFFGFETELVKNKLDQLNPLGYKILLEILVKCKPEKVCEVPYSFKERKHGKSKLGAKVMLDYLRHLARLSKHSRNYLPKFLAVGATGALVNFCVYNLVLHLLGITRLSIILAWLCGVEAGILTNFTLHEHWTFAPEQLSKSKKSVALRCLAYHLSNIGYILLTSATAAAVTWVLGKRPLLAWLAAIIVGITWNYCVARKIIWHKKRLGKY